MFRAVLCSSSGGQIVLLQHLVSSLAVNGRLFHFSICFEEPRAHHQENQLYQSDIFLTVHRSIDMFQITNLLHNSFIL